jgi:hypothetical protein
VKHAYHILPIISSVQIDVFATNKMAVIGTIVNIECFVVENMLKNKARGYYQLVSELCSIKTDL